ncbi:MAG: hypothetical protein JJ892_09770, partial [Balneola sp.]|nr:hypothetical protein [Balneola sp.]
MKQKKLPNRQSMRLQGYDYSSPGFYFITICTNQKEYLFGDVINGKMHLNEYGVVAHGEWFKTEAIRDNVNLDAFVVMPNHIHGIIEIIDKNPIVGANRDSPQRNKIGIN